MFAQLLMSLHNIYVSYLVFKAASVIKTSPFSSMRSISKKFLSSSIYLVLVGVDKILRTKDKSCVRRKYADAEYTDAGCTRILRAPLSLEQMGVNYIRHAKLYTTLLT